ncbi:beta-ketoacyl synthase N-terminal-like domain-containing protein [Mycobacterium sp. CVI_P3]|uniref:propanoyl-CoA C-acyltransferase n=1 Tax=Mycobacterium pinniadriaticum TaxID=2994102 RepID=A0ABT3SC05_9MYCO|nr:beta-ketoacyl synthase N-terminal-like domain-containing protein [Mycobacterium pinniadriaticum]MCX2930627.1 beta-ketoacyl synthase N-terminal-like domain-containing protein [Mycobacterium pinniadriaticum]MCX2937051.1 beta-ketoacyl synthase N-terminal-like domain-containing protein [Mycobacterium pinniadriaticum]
MSETVWIVGAAMTKFGRFPDSDVVDLGVAAALAALEDSATGIGQMQTVAVGNVFEGITGVGQRIMHQIGQTGAPVYNVSNACATGATALRTALLTLRAGEADLALAIGCEQLGKRGLLSAGEDPRGSEFTPRGRDGSVVEPEGVMGSSLMPSVFAEAGVAYLARNTEVSVEHFYKVAQKNHLNSTLNPLAQYRKEFSLEQIAGGDVIAYPNTALMCSPTGDGAAAVVLASDSMLQKLDPAVRARAVKVSASVLVSDPWAEQAEACWDVDTITKNAAGQAYEAAGLGPGDLDMVELHDCFATAELVHYENLGLCEAGGAGAFLDSGAPWRGGTTPVNISGGLLSKGHPLGATGIAGVFEVVTHLRGEAGDRQVEGARVGLAHVLGLGSACAVHVLERRAA